MDDTRQVFAYSSPVGGERASTTRRRLAGKICCRCGISLTWPARPFAERPLRLNNRLGQLDSWDEGAIRERAGRLAKDAVNVWPFPKLSSEVLEAYRPKSEISGYTIDAHPHLLSGKMKEVFEALRKGVLALDPNVYRRVSEALRSL